MDGDSWMWLRLLGPATSMLGVFGTAIAGSPIILYVIARWRAARDPALDPQLGYKFALHYFAMLALHALLGGSAVALHALLAGGSDRNLELRIAAGVMLPSAALLGGAIAMLSMTTDRLLPSVRRLFVGYNLLVAGIVAFVGCVMACEVLLSPGGGDGLGYVAGSIACVYGAATVGLLVFMHRLVVGGGPPSMAMPMPMPAAAPPAVHRE